MPDDLNGDLGFWSRNRIHCHHPRKRMIQYSRDLRWNRKAAAYWIPRWSLSSGSPKARPGGGGMTESPLLQFRRRRTVEHLAFRALEQIERVGLDAERPAHARQFRDLLYPREGFLKIRPSARTSFVDIEQFSCEQFWIRLGHVDPADALRRLYHAGAFWQIESEPAGGTVIRRQHAISAGANAHRFDCSGQFAPADADAAHGGVAAIARKPTGIGLHNQQRKHYDADRRRPAQAEIDQALLADPPWGQVGGDCGGDRERRIDRREPVGLAAGAPRRP